MWSTYYDKHTDRWVLAQGNEDVAEFLEHVTSAEAEALVESLNAASNYAAEDVG